MILEQAFFYLPEILTGSGYPLQRYEGGIVSAYSLAVLQALNGRNVPSPISCLQTERPFRGKSPWKRGNSGVYRYLRCDLYIRLDKLAVGSTRLSAYGWRFSNWLEAKFFRKSTRNKQTNTAGLLSDLLRLLALVPNTYTNDDKTHVRNGRYLLHVYEAMQPKEYLSVNRNLKGGGREERKWLIPLISSGAKRCPRFRLGDYESSGVLGEIGDNLSEIELEFESTTWVIAPVFDLGEGIRQYVCCLTRIDSFTILRGTSSLTISADRSIKKTPKYYQNVRDYVGQWISIKSDVEDVPPDLTEIDDE